MRPMAEDIAIAGCMFWAASLNLTHLRKEQNEHAHADAWQIVDLLGQPNFQRRVSTVAEAGREEVERL
jgi:hypothetical protein